MEYGGSDVSRCFHWLLQRSGFNPKEIDLHKVTDSLIMQEMKEQYCHLDQVCKMFNRASFSQILIYTLVV